ncbi:Poly(A) polymerase 1 [Heracleum sosnowskyi]|uniref:Poly(A) polymerase 1 n=1 Tax=Heracleum sosnowskyi TaxID=360622 RepID=A0AAD8HT56_9APIA|nr:Poly(A) polymerase 1 [Heracleum sosnowskyi]
MKERELDYILVPLGIAVLCVYHVWLLFTIKRRPTRTVIGINAQSRHQWAFSMMSDPVKNGVLAVQTIRNNIMASTLLATAAITLSSLISVYVSSSSDTTSRSSELIYGNKTRIMSSVKYFTILLCFLVAFLCNVQCISFTRKLHKQSLKEHRKTDDVESEDVESGCQTLESVKFEDMDISIPLLARNCLILSRERSLLFHFLWTATAVMCSSVSGEALMFLILWALAPTP